MTYLYQNPLIVVAILTILLSPFVLRLASNQDKKTKQTFKSFFILILSVQIILGFLTSLQLFLVVSTIQIILLLISKSFNTFVVILNFINSVLIFVEMGRLSNNLGHQIVSLPSIGAVFLVLIGNVVGLIYINNDANLLKKYFKA